MPLRLAALLACLAAPLQAADAAGLRAASPALFDPATGYRLARHQAPVPCDIPAPARRVDADETRALLAAGALAVDVAPTEARLVDPLDGQWLTDSRPSLPGAVWLPDIGWAFLEPALEIYLVKTLARLLPEPERPIVVFCSADCWLSWNAAQRIAALGYRAHWFAEGTDGWREAGWPLALVAPEPMPGGGPPM
jgi:PQQ-dependent catabolism-associated CXXCW motif protein